MLTLNLLLKEIRKYNKNKEKPHIDKTSFVCVSFLFLKNPQKFSVFYFSWEQSQLTIGKHI